MHTILYLAVRGEIGYYSVAYFNRITAFKAPYLRTSIRGGAQTRRVDSCRIYTACLKPALNGRSEIRRFERSDAIAIRNGITSDFYAGLPHTLLCDIQRLCGPTHQSRSKVGSAHRQSGPRWRRQSCPRVPTWRGRAGQGTPHRAWLGAPAASGSRRRGPTPPTQPGGGEDGILLSGII